MPHKWTVKVQFPSGKTDEVEVVANWSPDHVLTKSAVELAGQCQAQGKHYKWGSGGKPPACAVTSVSKPVAVGA